MSGARDTAAPALAMSFARRALEMTCDSLPEEVVAAGSAMLLNDLVCGCTADGQEAQRLRSVRPIPGSTSLVRCIVIGAEEPADAESAAFLNSSLIHSTVLDSTHYASQAHLGGPVIAAALATAQETGASSQRLLRAVIVGTEIASRIGEVLVAGALERGLRASSLFGPIGAAIASGVVRDLDDASLASAIALAGNFGAGSSQTWLDGSDDWVLQLGQAARAGVTAAALADVGFHGARRAFEGSSGLLRMLGLGRTEKDALTDVAASDAWRVLDTAYKWFPACNIVQVPARLLAGYMAGNSATRLDQVICHLNPDDARYPGTVDDEPAFRAAALMSVPFCLGVVLTHGRVLEAALSAPAADERILRATRRIRVVEDPSLAPLGCWLELRFGDGTHQRLRPPRGGWSMAWQPGEVAAHAGSRLADAGWSSRTISDFVSSVHALPVPQGLGHLGELLSHSRRSGSSEDAAPGHVSPSGAAPGRPPEC